MLSQSGRAILDALVAGESDPEKLANLWSTRVKASRKSVIEALRGRVTEHHRFLLELHLAQVDHLQMGMRELEARMGNALEPFRPHIEHLTTIPGVSDVVAQVIAGEVGLDMSRFPTAGHLVSWAGLCPRLDAARAARWAAAPAGRRPRAAWPARSRAA